MSKIRVSLQLVIASYKPNNARKDVTSFPFFYGYFEVLKKRCEAEIWLYVFRSDTEVYCMHL